MKIFGKYKLVKLLGLSSVVLFLGWWWFSLPENLFEKEYSFILESREGNLMGALIASDEQWRFPPPENIPDKFLHALIEFEDKRFYYHFGIDPIAIVRAVRENVKNKKIVSGGSTISMQLARLSRKSPGRTVWDKSIETLLALRIELRYSKSEILNLYATHAPFGGNVVGLEAASWRYFGRPPEDLSWAEAATLAVLPNNPSVIHPGRNRAHLKNKRNSLLYRLYKKEHFDSLSYSLFIEEPLPEKPKSLPQISPQLLHRAKSEFGKKQYRLRTTIDFDLQSKVNNLAKVHAGKLKHNHIKHLAVVVADVNTGQYLAYTGNVPEANQLVSGNQLDLVRAKRSTGSVLKPVLYAAMLTEGDILPESLIADIPTQIGSYSPQNFNLEYEGAVPAYKALARSLNVPAVRMLRAFGVEKFYAVLEETGFLSLDQPPGHYGLTLALGGAEGTLEDVASIYTGMSRLLNEYHPHSGKYSENLFRPLSYTFEDSKSNTYSNTSVLEAGAVWHTMEALLHVERPQSETGWLFTKPNQKIAWKTGTSFGFRDAWSVGITPEYVVAVWVGNADGEGRPGIIGIEAAAPLMFNVFHLLGSGNSWFRTPHDDLIEMNVCTKSGFKAGMACESYEKTLVPPGGRKSSVCPYHRIVHTDMDENWQINAGCKDINEIIQKSWFVLPPAMAHYFRMSNASYKPLPPLHQDCRHSSESEKMIGLIYPRHRPNILIPLEVDGNQESVIFEATHQLAGVNIYWHLNNEFLGTTKHFHKMSLQPKPGKHNLTLIDEKGYQISQSFEILPNFQY